jgi:hypothetical protein
LDVKPQNICCGFFPSEMPTIWLLFSAFASVGNLRKNVTLITVA